MSDEGVQSDGMNALYVRYAPEADKVCAGIYRVLPDGWAELIAGLQLEPEQCYEIAQRFTMCGIKLEESRKQQ